MSILTLFNLLPLAIASSRSSDVRLAWDASSGRSVSAGVYGRLEQTTDEHWLLGYSRGPAVYVRRSADGINDFGEEILVADNVNYTDTNVEMLTLQNGWVLLAYNARPFEAYHGILPYEIRVVLSKDHGVTWEADTAVYTAGKTPHLGCWEPIFLQYPDGEVQLFFANESPYPDSNEQEITMMRSFGNGATWESTAYNVCFRKKARDGMPVPVLLEDNHTVALAIEDNGVKGAFKPVILTSTLEKRFTNGPISGDSDERHYALTEASDVERRIYVGAPYLIRLNTGETVLSVQTSEGRSYDHVNVSVPKVYVGDRDALHFQNGTSPFTMIPNYGNGNWNSLEQIDQNRIALVSSIQGVQTSDGYESIWLMEAELIRPMQLLKFSPVIDGADTNAEWRGRAPVFIGSQSQTQLRANMQYDETALYLYASVNDATLAASSGKSDTSSHSDPSEMDSDGVECYLSFSVKETATESDEIGDPSATSGAEDKHELYKFQFLPENKVGAYKWLENEWIEQSIEDVQWVVHDQEDPDGNRSGYIIEAGIPWDRLAGLPDSDRSWRLNFTLYDDSHDTTPLVVESLAGCDPAVPTTWLPCELSTIPRITYFHWQQLQEEKNEALPMDWPSSIDDDYDLDGISNGSAFASGSCEDQMLSELIQPTLIEDHWVFGFQRHLGALEVKSHTLFLSLNEQPWFDLFDVAMHSVVEINYLEVSSPGIVRYEIKTSKNHTVKTHLQTEFWSF